MPKVKTKSGKTVHLPYTEEGKEMAKKMKKMATKPPKMRKK